MDVSINKEIPPEGRKAVDDQVKGFIDLVHGNAQKGWLVLSHKERRMGLSSHFYNLQQLDVFSSNAKHLAALGDVYFGVCLQDQPLEGKRGGTDSVVSMPGVWFDLDVQGENHKAQQLPPDAETALDFLKSFELTPSVIVSTGGGYHAYWLFDSPLEIETGEDRERAQRLSKAFQMVLLRRGADQGWSLDDTSDLARILRIPGTINHKNGGMADVTMVEANGDVRYSPTEIEGFLAGEALNAVGKQNESEFKRILEGTRNTELTSIAGALRAGGMEHDDILRQLLLINTGRCVPPLPAQEVKSIALSVLKYEPNRSGDGRQSSTQSQRLLEIAEPMELFHTPDGECYARIPVNGHKEVWSLKSKGVRDFLSNEYFKTNGTVAGSQALQDAIGILQAKARFDGQRQEVNVRVAESDGCIFLDLGNNGWETVRITPYGWEVLKDSPVLFKRSRGLLELPRPVSGGRIEDLFRFLNVEDQESKILIISFLIGSLRPTGPYPILVLQGEQGSAKSTTSNIIRSLIDPNASPLRALPKCEKDLMIAAQHSWCLSYDNLSGLGHQMSDALCRLSTGGGLSSRGLYTDSDEVILDAMRPVILNGIEDIATRPDLADRCLVVTLPKIPESKRRLERDLWRDYEAAKPGIIGSLLNAMSTGLRNRDMVKLRSVPRMADFSQFLVASEAALPWEPGQFLEVYSKNREDSQASVFESDVVAMAMLNLMEHQERWEGTAAILLEALRGCTANGDLVGIKSFPKTASQLSGRISRIADPLRSAGISVEHCTIRGRKTWKFSREE